MRGKDKYMSYMSGMVMPVHYLYLLVYKGTEFLCLSDTELSAHPHQWFDWNQMNPGATVIKEHTDCNLYALK